VQSENTSPLFILSALFFYVPFAVIRHEHCIHASNASGPMPEKSRKSVCTEFLVWTGILQREFEMDIVKRRVVRLEEGPTIFPATRRKRR
jgi:hypothetical protein